MEEPIRKRARKVVDAGSVPLAHLQESIQTNELLDVIASKEFPDEIEISLEGVEYIKGEKGDSSEYPQEISISNLPEVQKVEITNLPTEKDDKVQIKLLQDILAEAKKKEEYAYDIKIDAELKEELRGERGEDGLNGLDGKDGTEIEAEEIAEKLNTLEGAVDKKVIKGLDEALKEIKHNINNSRGVTGGAGRTFESIIRDSQVSKSFSHSGYKVVTMSSSLGTKAFTYDTSNRLISIAGTGAYRSKTFTYSGNTLINTTVL